MRRRGCWRRRSLAAASAGVGVGVGAVVLLRCRCCCCGGSPKIYNTTFPVCAFPHTCRERPLQMSAWNVTYGRWAESYDRSMARRSSLERRECLELEREETERRQRAEEEFQVTCVHVVRVRPQNLTLFNDESHAGEDRNRRLCARSLRRSRPSEPASAAALPHRTAGVGCHVSNRPCDTYSYIASVPSGLVGANCTTFSFT